MDLLFRRRHCIIASRTDAPNGFSFGLPLVEASSHETVYGSAQRAPPGEIHFQLPIMQPLVLPPLRNAHARYEHLGVWSRHMRITLSDPRVLKAPTGYHLQASSVRGASGVCCVKLSEKGNYWAC